MGTPVIAYLIVAHNNPALLARAVRAVQHPNTRVFIHVDKRADVAQFRAAVGDMPNVEFISKRYAVFWKGFTVVQATHALLARAVESGAERYVLLSGADYPLRSNEELLDFFSGNQTEYLHFFSLEDLPDWYRKVRRYFMWDSKFTNARQGYPGWSGRYHRYVRDPILMKLPERRFVPDMTPHGGSNWWMLSRETAEYCVRFFNEQGRFRRFYRFTDSPDEMVYQTIIMNSPLRERVNLYDQYTSDREHVVENIIKQRLGFTQFNLRYVDWYSPERGFPADLNESNFDEIAASGALFARKMHPQLSVGLMDRIDQELRHEETSAIAAA